jgi:hypothetical protein
VAGGRELLGGLLAGVGGAVLIAALVLGRGDAKPAMELAALDDGGVLVARVETYQRHGAKAEMIAGLVAAGDLYLRPEQYVAESWALLGPQAEMLEILTAIWTEDGELLERTSVVGRERVTERPGLGVVRRSTLPGGGLGRMQILPSGLLGESRADVEERLATGEWELVAPARTGTLVLRQTRSVQPGELEAQARGGVFAPYYADLQVVRIVHEQTYSQESWLVTEVLWAELTDGTRVLVESRRMTIEARGSEEWAGIVARVWGE